MTDNCYLCGDRAVMGGVFQPRVPIEWGAPEGKKRFFFYSLCQSCFDKPNHSYTLVEEKIISELKNLFPERS